MQKLLIRAETLNFRYELGHVVIKFDEQIKTHIACACTQHGKRHYCLPSTKFNPFKTNGIYHPYQLDQSIPLLGDIFFIFIQM